MMDQRHQPAAPRKRDASIWLHFGAKKTGKTTDTLVMSDDMWRLQRKPTLVFDIGNQPQYEHFQPIDLDELSEWTHLPTRYHTWQFRIFTDQINSLFDAIHLYVRNTFVVFEDSTSYMSGNLSKSKTRLILNSRNMANDYLFNMHSLAAASPELYLYSEWILLRQTGDNPEKLPPKIPMKDRVRLLMLEIIAENTRLYPKSDQYKIAKRRLDLQSL